MENAMSDSATITGSVSERLFKEKTTLPRPRGRSVKGAFGGKGALRKNPMRGLAGTNSGTEKHIIHLPSGLK
jgi:hypothetical protein